MAIETAPAAAFQPPAYDARTAVWVAAIRTALAERKNGASEAEVQRLAKTLARLEPAATDSLQHIQPSAASGNAGQAFADALKALAHE